MEDNTQVLDYLHEFIQKNIPTLASDDPFDPIPEYISQLDLMLVAYVVHLIPDTRYSIQQYSGLCQNHLRSAVSKYLKNDIIFAPPGAIAVNFGLCYHEYEQPDGRPRSKYTSQSVIYQHQKLWATLMRWRNFALLDKIPGFVQITPVGDEDTLYAPARINNVQEFIKLWNIRATFLQNINQHIQPTCFHCFPTWVVYYFWVRGLEAGGVHLFNDTSRIPKPWRTGQIDVDSITDEQYVAAMERFHAIYADLDTAKHEYRRACQTLWRKNPRVDIFIDNLYTYVESLMLI